MSQPSDDRDFEEYLSRQSQVSRSYGELVDSEVPVRLDQAVLAQATRAAKAAEKKPAKPVRNWTRWAAPLALAASMVLTLSVVMDSGVQEESTTVAFPARKAPQNVSSELKEAPPPASSSDAGAAPQVVPLIAPSSSEQLLLAIEPPALQALPAPAAPSTAANNSEPANIEPQKIESQKIESQNIQSQSIQSRSIENIEVQAIKRQEVIQQSPISVTSVTAEKIEAAGQSEAAKQSTAAVQAADAEKRTGLAADADVRAISSQRSRSTASEADLSEVMVTGSHRSPRPRAAAGPRHTIPMRSEPSAAELEKEEREAAPTLWLEYIRTLRADGKTRQADREWRAFLEAYPNVFVAEDDIARERL